MNAKNDDQAAPKKAAPKKAAPKKAAPAGELTPQAAAEIRIACGRFSADLPQGVAAKGHYQPVDGDNFAGERFSAPDGVYRVRGSHWLVEIADGCIVEISRAVAPKFGGDDVVDVPNHG